MPTAVLQGLGQQFGALVGVLGARGTHVVEYGDGLAQPVHGRSDDSEVGTCQLDGRAQLTEAVVVRVGQSAHEGVQRVEVGRAGPADGHERTLGPVVVQRGERHDEGGQFRLGCLHRRVQGLLLGLEARVGGRQLAESQDGGDRVVQFAGLAADHLVKVGVRQEGAGVVQRLLPAGVLEGTPAVARPPELDVGSRDVVARPGAGERGRPGVTGDGEADLDLRVDSVVQVAPVPAPYLAALLVEAGGTSGERRLDALGEAGLPRAVTPHHEGYTGLRAQRQTRLPANTAKAADADGVQEDPVVRVRADGRVGAGPRAVQRLADQLPGRLGEGGRLETLGQPGEGRGASGAGASALGAGDSPGLLALLRGLVVLGVFRHGALRPSVIRSDGSAEPGVMGQTLGTDGSCRL